MKSMTDALNELEFHPLEHTSADSRATTMANLRNVAVAKIADAVVALRDLDAPSFEEGIRTEVQAMIDCLVTPTDAIPPVKITTAQHQELRDEQERVQQDKELKAVAKSHSQQSGKPVAKEVAKLQARDDDRKARAEEAVADRAPDGTLKKDEPKAEKVAPIEPVKEDVKA